MAAAGPEIKLEAERNTKTPTQKTYPPAHISFETVGENELSVSIETERLQIDSINDEATKEYLDLYADPKVVEKFADGKPKDPNIFIERVKNWIERWKNNNPFSALKVSLKKSEVPSEGLAAGLSAGAGAESPFIGNIILGAADPAKIKLDDRELNASELAYLFHAKSWGKGFGTEAVTAVVQDYAPELASRHYLVNNNAFEAICATSRDDNSGSRRILLFQGMKVIGESFKFGAKRDEFGVSLETIKTRKAMSFKPKPGDAAAAGV